MERQEAAPRASVPDVRLPGGPGKAREHKRLSSSAAAEEKRAKSSRPRDSRGGRCGRVATGPERSHRASFARRPPDGTRRAVSPH